MERSARGDHAAFQELIERHQHAVVGTVSKMLGNSSDAEDLAQQTFLRLWKSRKKYQPKAKFTTYLFTIVRRLVFNETRKKTIRKTSSLDEPKHPSDSSASDGWHQKIADPQTLTPDESSLHKELSEAIDRAIEGLPEKQRLAIILRRYEELPYEEIASILKLSISAVKSQLFRARAELKEQLQRYLDPDSTT